MNDVLEPACQSTSAWINRRVSRQLEANLAFYARRLDLIEQRLDELGREWDVERTLEISAGLGSLFGLTMGLLWRRWLVLPALAAGFLIQHAVRGWCGPVSACRQLGIRTAGEISRERYALKALRGDFAQVAGEGNDPAGRAAKAMQAVGAG